MAEEKLCLTCNDAKIPIHRANCNNCVQKYRDGELRP